MSLSPFHMSALAVAMAVLAGCASVSPGSAAPAAPAAGAPAKATAALPGADRSLLARGYVAEKRGDGLVYCRSEMGTGTYLAKRVCRTADEIETADRKQREQHTAVDTAGGLNGPGQMR